MRASGEPLAHVKGKLASLGLAAFRQAHPCPILVVEIKDERSAEGFGTRLVDGPEEAAPAPDAPGSFAARSTLVFSVEKTDRNGFTDMISVGRTPNNDIVIPDRSVSKFHAYFKKDIFAEEMTIVDGGASNGTAIGTRRLASRSAAPAPSGTRIWFGPLVRALLLDVDAFWERYMISA